MSKETEDKRTEEEDEELDEKQAAEDEAEDEEDDREDEGDEDEDEEEDEDEHEPPASHGHEGPTHDAQPQGDEEDPSWWAPHVVLVALVLVGVLGFFGMFNKPLGFLAAKPAGATETASAATKPATPAPQPQPQPMPQRPQQPMAPREMFGAKHLLVMYKGSMRAAATITRTKEEAKARAEEALKKVKGGKKFEEVVAEYSDEPGAGARGGDLGTFAKGQMVGPFQEGVEKLKTGEVSGLVETPFGYHVILRTK